MSHGHGHHPGVIAGDDGSVPRFAVPVLVVLVALLLGVPLLSHDWPIGDGGLFYSMIGDVIGAGFALPDVSSYQGGVIPFAYPPLAFYLAASLEVVTHASRSDILRVLPVTATVLGVAAMYPLALEVTSSRRHALLTTAYFGALVGLTSYLVSGGGLTRSLGVLLALLATWQGFRMYRLGRWRDVALTAVLSGFALLAHPETGPFIAVALGSTLVTCLRRRTILLTIVAALGAALIAAPWIAAVAARHGIQPFLSAAATPDRDLVASIVAYCFLFLFTAPVIGMLDIVGQIQQAGHRLPRLLAWRIGAFAFDLRHAPISAAPPVSLLAAHGTLDVLTPAALSAVARLWTRELDARERATIRVAVSLVTLTLAFSPALGSAFAATGPTAALTRDQRAAMDWVRDHTNEATRIVVLSDGVWGSDIVREWFPALSLRTSLTTSQGYEWVSSVRAAQIAREAELRTCQDEPIEQASCVDSWIRRQAPDRDVVVFVAEGRRAGTEASVRRAGLAEALVATGHYRTRWSGPSGTVLEPV